MHQERRGADERAPAAGRHVTKSAVLPAVALAPQRVALPELERARTELEPKPEPPELVLREPVAPALAVVRLLPAARRGCDAGTEAPQVPRLPESLLRAQVPAELRPVCDGDERLLQVQPAFPVQLLLRALLLPGGAGQLWGPALMRARVFPSPSGREHAQSGRR